MTPNVETELPRTARQRGARLAPVICSALISPSGSPHFRNNSICIEPNKQRSAGYAHETETWSYLAIHPNVATSRTVRSRLNRFRTAWLAKHLHHLSLCHTVRHNFGRNEIESFIPVLWFVSLPPRAVKCGDGSIMSRIQLLQQTIESDKRADQPVGSGDEC